jgi:hypothetical protein
MISFTSFNAVATNHCDATEIDTFQDRVLKYKLLISRYTAEAIEPSADWEVAALYRNIDEKGQLSAVLTDRLDVGPDAIADSVHSSPEHDSKTLSMVQKTQKSSSCMHCHFAIAYG